MNMKLEQLDLHTGQELYLLEIRCGEEVIYKQVHTDFTKLERQIKRVKQNYEILNGKEGIERLNFYVYKTELKMIDLDWDYFSKY